ncbi:MAG: FAD-binding oxidoreductase [Alphaproteobacteria bacterium]|nr:FAD-binding oxidoreductase [Alphaproteobacteria bacterium]
MTDRPANPDSLWVATAEPAAPTPPLEGEAKADVAVVGGGFTGLSTALHLAEAGVSVVLVEAAEPGWGASGRNGGQAIPGLKLDPDEIEARFGPELGPRVVELVGGAADFVFGLIRRHGISCHAAQRGWISASFSPAALALAGRRVEQWQRRGVGARLLDRATAAALMGTDRYVGGWLDPRGGALQPLSYARGLARAAIRQGARIHGASPATVLRRDGAQWRVETPGGSVVADQVVLATNGYTDTLWPGLARSIIPVFSYQVATRPLSDNLRRTILPERHVVSDTRRLLLYFRLDHDGRLLMGGRGKLKDSSDPNLYGYVKSALAGLFPQLDRPDYAYFWGGKVAITTDQIPHLHELAPGLHAGLGYNGRGVAMASAMGRLLALRAQGKSATDIPYPISSMRPIPFHGLRLPVLQAIVGWRRMMDRLEAGAR